MILTPMSVLGHVPLVLIERVFRKTMRFAREGLRRRLDRRVPLDHWGRWWAVMLVMLVVLMMLVVFVMLVVLVMFVVLRFVVMVLVMLMLLMLLFMMVVLMVMVFVVVMFLDGLWLWAWRTHQTDPSLERHANICALAFARSIGAPQSVESKLA